MGIIDDREIDLPALGGRFIGWLQRQPGCASHRLVDIRQASQSNGFSNETYRMVVASTEGAREELILRLPPSRTGLFPDYDIARQYAFMQGLHAEPGVAMARCRWLETSPATFGRPFFVADFVPGSVAADNPCYVREGWIVGATFEQRRSLWDSTLDQLVRLSHVRWAGERLQAVDWPGCDTPRILQHIESWRVLGAWGRSEMSHEDAPDSMQAQLRHWLIEQAPNHDEAGIVWGDSRFGNVIYQDFRAAALLDWELAVVGDPMIDLAYMLFHVFLMQIIHGDERTGQRLAGFRGDEETVALYCERTGRTARDYRYYWLFNAYKMLCIWECKSALMLRSGTWSRSHALEQRSGALLHPHVESILAGDDRSAYLR